MVSILARLKWEGIVDETGLLAEPYFEEGIRIGDVCVTQEAIRAIQLAKGAVRAGIQILMQEYGIIPEQIGRCFTGWKENRPDINGPKIRLITYCNSVNACRCV